MESGVVRVFKFTVCVDGKPVRVFADYSDARAFLDLLQAPRSIWRSVHYDDGFTEKASRQLVVAFQ